MCIESLFLRLFICFIFYFGICPCQSTFAQQTDTYLQKYDSILAIEYNLLDDGTERYLALAAQIEQNKAQESKAYPLTLERIANVYFAELDYPNAKLYAQRQIQARERYHAQDFYKTAQACVMLGEVYQMSASYDSIELAFDKAKKYLKQFDNPDSSAWLYSRMYVCRARMALNKEDEALAEKYLLESIRYCITDYKTQATQAFMNMNYTINVIAETLIKKRREDKIINYIDKTKTLFYDLYPQPRAAQELFLALTLHKLYNAMTEHAKGLEVLLSCQSKWALQLSVEELFTLNNHIISNYSCMGVIPEAEQLFLLQRQYSDSICRERPESKKRVERETLHTEHILKEASLSAKEYCAYFRKIEPQMNAVFKIKDRLTYYESYVAKLIDAEEYDSALLQADIIISYVKNNRSRAAEYLRYMSLQGLAYAGKNDLANYEKLLLLLLSEIERLNGLPTLQAETLNNLARCYESKGDVNNTKIYYQKAIKFCKQSKLENSVETFAVYNNYASFLLKNKDYQKAEILFKAALNIANTKGAAFNDYTPYICNNYAGLYREVGNYEKAIPLFEQSIKLFKEALGDDHPNVLKVMSNLAICELRSGAGKESSSKVLYIKDRLEQKQLTKSMFYPQVLTDLASVYALQKNYDSAAHYAKLSKEIAQKNGFATTAEYFQLGMNAMQTQLFTDCQAVIQLSQELEDLHTKQFPNSPNLKIQLYANTMKAYFKLKQLENAEKEAQKLLILYYDLLNTFFRGLSEKEKGSFSSTFEDNINSFNLFALAYYDTQPRISQTIYNNQLRTKALLLQSNNQLRERVWRSNNKKLKAQYEELKIQREHLANLYKLSDAQIKTQKINLDSINEAANALEKEVLATSEKYKANHEKQMPTWQAVQKKLKPNEVAVEVVRISDESKVYYAMLIVSQQTKEQPVLIRLDSGHYLENEGLMFYRNAIQLEIEDTLSYKNYWLPLMQNPALKGIKKLYFSADGVYNSININTLYNPESKKYVIDELELILLTNTNELLLEKSKQSNNNSAMLYGFPDYTVAQNNSIEYETDENGQPQTLERFFTFGGKISVLPGTKAEIESISQTLRNQNAKYEVYMLREASEDNIKKIQSPSVLHVATHGFFLSNREMMSLSKRAAENPLFRSGLLLAGAEGGMLQPNMSIENLLSQDSTYEDGILTAYEAANLQLQGTKLVVLSACETGLGEVKNGEGVYGLQRAFKVAGAEGIMMSLWKVDDATTQELMTLFYRFAQKKTTRQAFEAAQLELRKKNPQPYHWGAFVFLGQ